MQTIAIERPTNAPAQRRRRRWGKPVGLALAALLVVAACVRLGSVADRRLRDVLAETDRLDPGWHTAELEAARAVIPDEDNSAPHVVAVHQALPPDVQLEVPARPWTLLVPKPAMGKAAPALGPNQLLDASSLETLSASLASAQHARDLARALTHRSRGRHQRPQETMDWRPPSTPAPVEWVQKNWNKHQNATYCIVDNVTRFLMIEALFLSEQGDSDAALASCRRALNAARSFGDAPDGQYARANRVAQVLPAVEQVLALGEPSESALADLQQLLEDEAAQPFLLICLRWHRAQLADQELPSSAGWDAEPPLAAPAIDYLVRVRVKWAYAEQLRSYTDAVELARRAAREGYPPDDRQLSWAVSRASVQQMKLREAITLLALERFRRAKGHWPESLKELEPAFLSAVPDDPASGPNPRYRFVLDGVEVGPHLRLWDVAKRRLASPPR